MVGPNKRHNDDPAESGTAKRSRGGSHNDDRVEVRMLIPVNVSTSESGHLWIHFTVWKCLSTLIVPRLLLMQAQISFYCKMCSKSLNISLLITRSSTLRIFLVSLNLHSVSLVERWVRMSSCCWRNAVVIGSIWLTSCIVWILLPPHVRCLTTFLFMQTAGAIIGKGGSNIRDMRQEVTLNLMLGCSCNRFRFKFWFEKSILNCQLCSAELVHCFLWNGFESSSKHRACHLRVNCFSQGRWVYVIKLIICKNSAHSVGFTYLTHANLDTVKSHSSFSNALMVFFHWDSIQKFLYSIAMLT